MDSRVRDAGRRAAVDAYIKAWGDGKTFLDEVGIRIVHEQADAVTRAVVAAVCDVISIELRGRAIGDPGNEIPLVAAAEIVAGQPVRKLCLGILDDGEEG